MLKINKDTVLTPIIIKRIIESNVEELARLNKLERYYLSKTDILQRQMKDINKPNNKIVSPYANYITDVLTGYFMGEPVSYSSLDSTALEGLTHIFDYNDEQDENMELAKNASIYGTAYELLYMDENGDIRFKILDTKECIPVYDDTLEQDLLYLIRYYKGYDIVVDKYYYTIEVIGKESIATYKANENLGSIEFVEEVKHFFNLVPVAIYKNNDENMGDFEAVISLIDAYDKLASDSLNDFEYFCDAYLALYGFTAEPEDIQEMKENRVLLMDHDTSAEWLIKNAPDATLENLKNRLDNDIHRFSKTPNLTDENFASNSSGVAIKYKLIGTENLTAIKERKFKKGLQRRIELISNITSLMSGEFDWRAIDISFSRSLPANDNDASAMIAQLKGLVSEETLLSQLSFVDNVEDELKRVKKQRDEAMAQQQELMAQQGEGEGEEEASSPEKKENPKEDKIG